MNQLEEDKELKDIQANLMDQMEESDSDADDDGGIDKKEVRIEDMNIKTVMKEERGPTPNDAQKVKSEVKTEDSSGDMNTINLAERFEEYLQCKLCYKKFGSKEALEKHKEVGHREDQRELAITFFTLQDLVYPCEACPVKFISENLLNKHKKTEHNAPLHSLSSSCQECGKRVKYHGMKEHLKTHSKEKNFSCQLCYRTFRLEKYLWAHQKKIHQDHAEYLNRDITVEDLKFDCDSCDMKFVMKDILEYHQAKAHSEQPERSFKVSLKCFFCEETFSNGGDRNKHCYNVHGKKDEPVGEKIRCMVCQKIIGKSHISEHKLRHTRVEKYQCILCYTDFSTNSNRKIHARKCHNSEEELKFLKLKEAERSPDLLKYDCQDCSLKFLNDKLLKNHQKTHGKNMKLKGFKVKKEPLKIKVEPIISIPRCTLCYRKFSSKRNLRKHRENL